VLRQWQAYDAKARELKALGPALQQLLVGICIANQQLHAAAADITASTVTAALQQARSVLTHRGAADAAGVVGAASAAAFAAVASMAPLAHDAAAAAARAAVRV
jgi:hypothetical protein